MNNFLNKVLLNGIEGKIANLHNSFKEKFNITETSLRNIEVNDNLDSKILYINFPWESFEKINDVEKQFITINDDNYICARPNVKKDSKYIAYKYKNQYIFLYYKFNNSTNNLYNYIRYKMPSDYGKISNIDNTDIFYPYIKIKEDEYKLLEYQKKEWVDNEIPYLQYIDNIEEGINNVAKILFTPAGYEYKEWTTTGYYGIGSNDYGLAQKPISQKDFDRWNKNIELLESIIDSFFNIWNVVSYVKWDEKNEYEWEE